MQKSIILEIQKLATEKNQDISDLLRKALLVASKLKLTDFRAWIENELNGYQNGPVPEYRKLRATVRLKNPYHGLIPVFFPTAEMADIFCNIHIRDPIGNLVSILEKQGAGKSDPIYPLTPEQELFLVNHQDSLGLPPIRTVSSSKLATIIDLVRTKVLDWSLSLEEKGILGQGLTFSEDEKKMAVSSPSINIQNFQGVLGDVTNSTLSQDLNMTVKTNDYDSLESFLLSTGVSRNDLADLKNAIYEDPKPITRDRLGDRVSAWMGRMLTKAANGSWQISVATAGNLLAQAIGAYYGF
ncbi:MAG: hypothetical protein PHN75_05030 [Syntrophales bacterium]|nr:hypothetical protein [Syntrophales bacterium]